MKKNRYSPLKPTVEEMCANVQKFGCSELVDWLKANVPDAEQAKELAAYMHMSSDDVFLDLWGKFNWQQAYVMHPLVGDELMFRLSGGRLHVVDGKLAETNNKDK